MKLEVARPVGQILIAAAAFLILAPVINVGFQVLPWNPGNQSWRFGALGYLLGAMTMPTLGLGLLGVGGVLRESRLTIRLTMVLASLFLLLAVGGLALFLVDGSALKAVGNDPKMLTILSIEMRRTGLITALAIPALAALTIGSYNLGKTSKSEVAESKGSGPLMRAGG